MMFFKNLFIKKVKFAIFIFLMEKINNYFINKLYISIKEQNDGGKKGQIYNKKHNL
jgi:hypothetical protein